MLDALFGNKTAARVLLYLQNYGDGYARAIADTFGIPLYAVQKQLQKLEQEGVLVCEPVGRTKVYTFNPRSEIVKQLQKLLQIALLQLPDSEKQKYYLQRRRPRRQGKPL